MAVFRVQKTDNYTVMSNHHFREKGLSMAAKGLLSLMLSLPDEWDYSLAGLVAISKEGKTAVRSMLNELKEFGYVKVTKLMPNQTGTGRIEYIYDIFECPRKQDIGKQDTENLYLESLDLENQYTENRTQLNTKESSTKELNTNKVNTNKYKELDSEFEILWGLYPRKQGKQKAKTCYLSARKKGTSFEEIEDGIKRYCDYIESKKIDTQYIKQGSTFFSQQAWQDEYEAKQEYDDSRFGGIL